MDDIGTEDEIRKWAASEGSEVFEMELLSQFRCNGSDGYLAWIDQVLGIRETANYDLEGIDFGIRILDSPSAVRDLIIEKNKSSNRARMLAGYCWEWDKKQANNTDHHDIRSGNFEMSWNLDGGQPFAIADTSVNEIGCIHTSQGLEFDYVGVIIGDDLRYEHGTVVTDFTKRAKTDQKLNTYLRSRLSSCTRGIDRMKEGNASGSVKDRIRADHSHLHEPGEKREGQRIYLCVGCGWCRF